VQPHLIGIDLGGTHLRAVRMDETGAIHAHRKVRTAATAGPAAVVEQIVDLVDYVTRNTQHAPSPASAWAWPGRWTHTKGWCWKAGR
jgi:predicted NBD/HSP70 family sugar kinase